MAAGQCVFSFASWLSLRAGTIWSDSDAEDKVAIAYCLGDVTSGERVGDRGRRRLEEEWCSGLSKVCQVVRVDGISGGAYLVDDVRWFDGALLPSLGCSSSWSAVRAVSVELLHLLSAVSPWCLSRFLAIRLSSASLLQGCYRVSRPWVMMKKREHVHTIVAVTNRFGKRFVGDCPHAQTFGLVVHDLLSATPLSHFLFGIHIDLQLHLPIQIF